MMANTLGRAIPAILMITLMACCTSEKNTDFDILCNQMGALVNLENFEAMSFEDRSDEYIKRLGNVLSPESNAYVAWTAIANAVPEERYELLQEAAKSTGVEGWECDSLKAHVSKVGYQ